VVLVLESLISLDHFTHNVSLNDLDQIYLIFIKYIWYLYDRMGAIVSSCVFVLVPYRSNR